MMRYTLAEVVEMLNDRVADAGSMRALSRAMGVSAPYLNDVLHGARQPGPKILSHLGIVRLPSPPPLYERI